MRDLLWEVGTRCFALGCAYPRLRRLLWLLGRFFVRRSGVTWQEVCNTVDDHVADGLNDQLRGRVAR